jgi:hypothetical protein
MKNATWSINISEFKALMRDNEEGILLFELPRSMYGIKQARIQQG